MMVRDDGEQADLYQALLFKFLQRIVFLL
jgi:hypothetical protein